MCRIHIFQEFRGYDLRESDWQTKYLNISLYDLFSFSTLSWHPILKYEG